MGKLTGKGKHTVKLGNHPHTNVISKPATMRRRGYKCRKWELPLKLRDQQLKTTFIYTECYIKCHRKCKQKTCNRYTHKKEKQQKHNIKNGLQTTRQEDKREGEEKRLTKTNPKQLRKW